MTAVRQVDGRPVRSFTDRKAWAKWLRDNHTSSPGIWVRLPKKGTATRSVAREEALDAALCYGWIDGQGRSDGDEFWLQKFTPRGKRSTWSKRNREKVAALIASGEMQPAGLAEVERARHDGRWERAYDSPANATVPPDLESALKRNARARRSFEQLDARNRYAILFRIQTAKKPETRAARIAKFVAMLARGETLH